MTLDLTRRVVVGGVMAQLVVSCGGGPTPKAANPQSRSSQSAQASDVCRQLATAMQKEVFEKVQKCREILHQSGIKVTPKIEAREIARCIDRIKRLFDLKFVSFEMPTAPEPWPNGEGRRWTIGFRCDRVDVPSDQTVRGRGRVVMDFRNLA